MALKKKAGETGIGISNLFKGGGPYGSYRAPEGTQRIATLEIMPDPQQPRRLLPKPLYDKLFAGEATPQAILQEWLALANQPNANPAVVQAIADLEQLATTIAWRDLISPITIRKVQDEAVPAEVQYLIRTGERRWWSHVWLLLKGQTIAEQQSPETIRAIVETGDEYVRADQWIENQARTDLSVVEIARGLEAVRAEMSQGKSKKVAWKEVEERLGISNNYRLRVMNILKLQHEVVGLIAEYALSERAVRPLVDRLLDYPALQLPTLLKLLEWRANNENSSNERLLAYIEGLLPAAKTAEEPPAGGLTKANLAETKWLDTFGRSVNRILDVVDNKGRLLQLSQYLAQDPKSLAAIKELRQQLDEIIQLTDEE